MVKLVARGGQSYRAGRAVLWAFSWGLGAAIGVAAGAWLTVVGEASAPGIEAIDPGVDLIALPAAAFATVFVIHLFAQAIAALVRGRRLPTAERPSRDAGSAL